jgi:hypothetical protein
LDDNSRVWRELGLVAVAAGYQAPRVPAIRELSPMMVNVILVTVARVEQQEESREQYCSQFQRYTSMYNLEGVE